MTPKAPIIDPDDDARDGMLFRLWIRLAETHPSDVAKELAPCVSASDHRRALMWLAEKWKVNLP